MSNPPQSTAASAAAEAGRLAGFSGACFAIIITLLVIEIRRPDAPHGQSGRALTTPDPLTPPSRSSSSMSA